MFGEGPSISDAVAALGTNAHAAPAGSHLHESDGAGGRRRRVCCIFWLPLAQVNTHCGWPIATTADTRAHVPLNVLHGTVHVQYVQYIERYGTLERCSRNRPLPSPLPSPLQRHAALCRAAAIHLMQASHGHSQACTHAHSHARVRTQPLTRTHTHTPPLPCRRAAATARHHPGVAVRRPQRSLLAPPRVDAAAARPGGPLLLGVGVGG
jgi:hypothetical protein